MDGSGEDPLTAQVRELDECYDEEANEGEMTSTQQCDESKPSNLATAAVFPWWKRYQKRIGAGALLTIGLTETTSAVAASSKKGDGFTTVEKQVSFWPLNLTQGRLLSPVKYVFI